MISLYVAHIRPLLDYCSTVWNVGYVGDSQIVENVQRRWTRSIDGMAGLDYGARLRRLDLFSVKGRMLRSDLIKYWKILRGDADESLGGLFQSAPRVGTRGHAFRLVLPSAVSDMKRRFFPSRCVRVWNGLPAEVVEGDSLTSFKRLLAVHLGDRLFLYD